MKKRWKKKWKIKRATQLTIFSTVLMVAIFLVLYAMAIVEINNSLGGLMEISVINIRFFALFFVVALTSFVVSAILIDKIMNPIRLMISKINEVGNMDFSAPLSIDEDDAELREFVFAFNSMATKLNRYIARQNRFISDASHELATPITVINGHADMMLRLGKEQPALLDSGLAVIKSEVLRMDGLVSSLLLLARSDSSRETYKFEAVNITALLQECVDEARLVSPEFSFELDAGEGNEAAFTEDTSVNIMARCDEYAIRRVVRIILSNATRYARADESASESIGESSQNEKTPVIKGKIRIKAITSHGIVQVIIADNGIGIPPEHLPYIFERFYRVDASRSKKSGGSGLGLSIAKEIITAHGGEISAKSVFGEGAEFLFTLSS